MPTRSVLRAFATLLIPALTIACAPNDAATADSTLPADDGNAPSHVARIQGRVYTRAVLPVESAHVRIDMEHLDSVAEITSTGVTPAMLEGAETWSDSSGRFTLVARLFRARRVPDSLLLAVHTTLAPLGDSAARKMDTVWVRFARADDPRRDSTAATLLVTLPTFNTRPTRK